MKNRSIFVCVISILWIGGCASEEDRANDFFRALSTSTTFAKVRAQSMYPGEGSHAVDLSMDCMEGGTHRLVGTLARGQDFQEDYEMTLAGCTVDGIAMTGAVAYTLNTAGDVGVTHYAGDVELGGALEGSCSVDLTLTATQSPSGCEFSYAGTICGISGLEPLGPDCPTGL